MAMQINKIKRKLAKHKHADADIFDVHNVMEYGFPSSPSAIAYDPHLGLLALASGSGEIRIYGQTGVFLVGKHEKPVQSVSQLSWIPNEGRLISLTEQNGKSTLSLFEINTKAGEEVLESVKQYSLETKKATAFSVMSSLGLVLVGTQVGDTIVIDAKTFELQEDTIHLDVAMQNVPEDLKLNPGSVQSILPHPANENLVLIGYHSGLLVLWNLADKLAQGTFYTSCSALESIAWYKSGSKFVTAHADGSYFTWSVNLEERPQQTFPFADSSEPAEKISKIQMYSGSEESSEDFLIFAGGLPKHTYASTYSVCVKQGDKQVNYETASKVIDLLLIESVEKPEPTEAEATEESAEHEASPSCTSKLTALAVLTEQELIMIDLKSTESEDGKCPQWPEFRKPYLNSASPNDITCLYFYEDCGAEFLQRLTELGDKTFAGKSAEPWPVFGGSVKSTEAGKLNVAVVGHYDGTVRFYDTNNGKFSLLYVVNLNDYFLPEDLDEEPATEENLGDVTLRKVGQEFGTCGDDNRFAVCKLYICPKTEKLFVGSHSGQIVVFQFADECPSSVPSEELKIVPDEANFKWKGAHPAKLKDLSEEELPGGYVISLVVQCEPPAPVTAMAVNTKYGLIAAGTSHGFGVFDIVTSKVVMTRSTLVENDESASGAKLSKSKSLREGIRNSFRRLKPKKAEAAPEPAAKAESSQTPEKPVPAVTVSPAESPKTEEAKEEGEKTEETAAADAPAEPSTDAAEESKPEVSAEDEKKDSDEARTEEEKKDESEEKPEEKTEGEEAKPEATEEVKEEEKPEEVEKAEEPAEVESKEPVVEASPPAPVVTIVEPEEEKGTPNVSKVVEARGERPDKTMMSTVRYLFFADTFLRNSKENTPSLWIGTHAGSVYSYLIALPEERETGEATLRLAKEIKLLHRAPIVYMNILDHSGFPLPDAAAVVAQKASEADMSGHHHLLVCSEEQMKLFTLPALKSKYKEKLTAVHGVKVRKVAAIKHKTDASAATHNFIACMLNDGSLCTFSLPALFRQYNYDLIKADNKIASMFTEFDQDGLAYVLQETNLIKEYAVFKKTPKVLSFAIDLPEGARPVPEPEPEPVVEETKAEEEVQEEVAEAENAEAVESTPAEAGEEQKEGGEEHDLPTVEEEAKKMIDDAEESKDEEFQKRIQEELTPDNPVLTTKTVTTYRAIESRTTISSDDGTQVSKIITTTRDTTLSLDGDVVTQKSQQKEEFEISPSEEQPPEEIPTEETPEEKPTEDVESEQTTTVTHSVTITDAEGHERETEKVETVIEEVPADEEAVDKSGNVTSDDEVNHAESLQVETEATPVRTATLTHNEEVDQITHHIGEAEEPAEGESKEESTESAPVVEEIPESKEEPAEPAVEEAVEAKEEESVESVPVAVEPEEPAEPTVEEPEEPKEETTEQVPETKEEPAEPTVEEAVEAKEEESVESAVPVETEEPTTETSEDTLKEEIPVEEPQPEGEKDSEEPAPTDSVEGECYGGSQGHLYSPLAAETNEEPAEAPVETEPEPEPEVEGLTPECYGGSQGALYSPMGRETQDGDLTNGVVYEANGDVANGEEETNQNGDLQNGHGDENGIGGENGDADSEAKESADGDTGAPVADVDGVQAEDEGLKKPAAAIVGSEEETAPVPADGPADTTE